MHKLGIPAADARGGGDYGGPEELFASILAREAMAPWVLFVTPEGLVRNQRLQELLRRLAAAGCLARVALDECHCVSEWGHGEGGGGRG